MKTYLRATAWNELAALDTGTYGGLSFGAEFCHRRLPANHEVGDALALCNARGLAFSLVTPLVRQAAFEDVSRWLSKLVAGVEGLECVFNDWGLLHWARRERLPLHPVAGRLLGHQRRDPRVVSMAAAARSPEEAESLRGSLWDDPASASFLCALGVERVELDLLLQGIRRPSLPPHVSLSLCGPWIPVTLSPACSWTDEPLCCSHPCRAADPVVLRNSEDPHPLWSRGNALFARNDRRPTMRELAALGAGRLVWAEGVPG